MKCLLALYWHILPLLLPVISNLTQKICLWSFSASPSHRLSFTRGDTVVRKCVNKSRYDLSVAWKQVWETGTWPLDYYSAKKNVSPFCLCLQFYPATQMNHTDLSKKRPMSALQCPPLCMLDVKVGHQMSCATDQRGVKTLGKRHDCVPWQSSWDDCRGSQLRHIHRKWFPSRSLAVRGRGEKKAPGWPRALW